MSPARAPQRGVRRPAALLLLILGVVGAHLGLGEVVLGTLAGAVQPAPRRIDVVFVQTLQPREPPMVGASPAPPRRLAVPAPAAAASAASLAGLDAEPPPELNIAPAPPPLDPLPEAPLATLADLAAAAPQADPEPSPTPETAAASSAEAFATGPQATASSPSSQPSVDASAAPSPDAEPAPIWPPSTRLRYVLTGEYRGPVQGQAQVEWLRQGSRYQVLMDLSIGPSFAPLMSRRVSSEGLITPQGLWPQRYDEVTSLPFRAPRALQIALDAEQIRLPRGGVQPRPAGVQDSASQFVQLTWLFTTRPDLLQPGQTVTLPLALPRLVEPWTYTVGAPEVLDSPVGPVPAVPVRPLRPPRPGPELQAELWLAPGLQYLPVRIRISQDAHTYLDLMIDQLPEQAAR